jgi:hypothetical protein
VDNTQPEAASRPPIKPPDQVILFGMPHPVVFNLRPSVRKELGYLWGENDHRAAAAIVGLCCPSLGIPDRLRESYSTICKANAATYGALIWDLLIERGVDDAELLEAGQAILPAIVDRVFRFKVRRKEVDEEKGFTEATVETSSSPDASPGSAG